MIPQRKTTNSYLKENLWNDYQQNEFAHFEKNFVFENSRAKMQFATEVVQIHCPDYHIEAKCSIQDLSIKINLLEKDNPVLCHNVPYGIIEEIDYLFYKYNQHGQRFFH